MSATDIKSDLQALLRLYGLLRNDGDWMSNKQLDEHARFLLKNLLDAATQRVLKAHAQMIAARVEASSLVSPTRTLRANAIVTEAVTQSFGKEQGSDQKRKMDGQDMWTEHRSTPERTVEASVPEYRKKRCMVCQKSSVKQLESIHSDEVAEILNNYNEAEPPLEKREGEPESVAFNRNCDYSEMGKQKGHVISNLKGFTANESEEGNSISKEASEAIIEIESCIAALQLGADHFDLFEPNNTLRLSTSEFTRIRGQALGSSLSNELRESVEARNMHTQQANADQQKVKTIIEKIESGKWRTNHNNFLPREIQNQDKNKASTRVPNWPATSSSSVSKSVSQEKGVMAMKDKSRGHVMFQPYKPSENSPQLITNGNIDSSKKHPSNARGITVANKNGFPKNRNYYTKSGKSLGQHELEKTASPISYSSNWSSEQNSSYGSDSEEYSSPGTNSEEYSPLSSEIQGQYSTSTSTSEEDAYSSPGSDEARELTSSNSSKSDGNSSYNHHRSIQFRSKEVDRRRIRKPANEINQKKQSGTWKRLKDKLAVVFHHHHHHHHNDDNHYNKGKSFLSKRDAEACGEKAVEKMRRSVIHGNKEQNHFHGIMEAVLSHVRRSKKNKVEKMVPLTKDQRGNKKAVKKSKQELWKLGVGKKKPRLKALPKIK